MKDVINYDYLGRIIEEGVARSAAELRTRHAGGRVVSYALCSDDELSGLYDVAFTEDLLKVAKDPSDRFNPVEWSLAPAAQHLEQASALLRQRASLDTDGEFHTQIDRAFECLVRTMERIRGQGLFADDVFVTICSTDPSEGMRELEAAAILRLNSPAVIREWRTSQLAGARSWLAMVIASRKQQDTFALMDREERLRAEIAQVEGELGQIK